MFSRKVPQNQEEEVAMMKPLKQMKRRRRIKSLLLAPDLQEIDVRVYQNALQKHNWDVNGAFTELLVTELVNLINKDYQCQILKNIESIKEVFEPRNLNTTPAICKASYTISTGRKEDENLKGGGMEEISSGEQHVLAEEIDEMLSFEDRASVYQELQTMILNLGSKLKSFLPASEMDRGENSRAKGIQIANDDTRLAGSEDKFKWSHFETALNVIHEMFCRAPSIELADDLDNIVDTKIVCGTYDYSHDESVVRFVEKVLHYSRLVRDLFSKDLQTHKEQLRNEIEFEIESLKNLLEDEISKIEEQVKFLAKAGSRAYTKLSLLKWDLEKTTKQKKHLEFEVANLVVKLNQLNSDIERREREKNEMATDQNEIEQFVRSTLDEYRRNAHRIEEILRERLRNLDRVLVQDEERHRKEMEMVKMVVLRTSIQSPVTSSRSRMNPVLVKEE